MHPKPRRPSPPVRPRNTPPSVPKRSAPKPKPAAGRPSRAGASAAASRAAPRQAAAKATTRPAEQKPVESRPAETRPAQDPFERRTLARFDDLGQTLVATVVVSTLSGPDSERLKVELFERMRGGPEQTAARHIVFDLQNVQYMDSGCIGVLVELLTSIQKCGGRIALVNTGHNVEYLFKLTRLDRLFPVCRDVMRAIEVVEREG
jgi:anti-anti-sigma factor